MDKRLLLFGTCLFLALSCGRDRIAVDDNPLDVIDHSGYIFDDRSLPRLTVSIGETEWNDFLAAYDKESHNRDYFRCKTVTMEKDGRTFTTSDAGIRLRGNTSRRRPEGSKGQKHDSGNPRWHHAHFGLNFRKFNEDGGIDGIRRINLKYPKEDPTYVREHFCFDMLEMFGVWTAPKTSWCRLSIRVGDSAPANFGVYLMMESIDRQYIKRRPAFGSGDGFLWKCGWGASLRDTDDRLFHLDDDSAKSYVYTLKEEDPALFSPAKAQLQGFIRNLVNLKGADFHDWIRGVCDVDLLLRMYAANTALGHWDDYWNNKNNLYLYFDSRDKDSYKVYLLPYDYDNTLGTSHNCGVQNDSGRHDPYNWGISECMLISKILGYDDFRAIYTGYLNQLACIDNPYTGVQPAMTRIGEWQRMLSPYVANDTGEDMEIKDRPASWGNHHEYRIMSDGASNWFRVKCESLKGWIGYYNP